MKLVPMRFGGVEWHHNPRNIEFVCNKNISEQSSPYGGSLVQTTGRKNMLIKGSGELFGSDCPEQFNRLLELFRKNGEGVLSIPRIKPIFAVFESLKLEGMPKDDVLTYSFVFREKMETQQEKKREVCVAKSGQSLWDISYIHKVDINTLVKLNPQLKTPDDVEEGSVIRLC